MAERRPLRRGSGQAELVVVGMRAESDDAQRRVLRQRGDDGADQRTHCRHDDQRGRFLHDASFGFWRRDYVTAFVTTVRVGSAGRMMP